MKQVTIKYLFILLFAIPVIHLALSLTFKISLEPLKGEIRYSVEPTFSMNDWIEGKFQVEEEKYLEENISCRNLYVRLINQIDYYLFNKANVNGVIIGKHNFLFEESYIHSLKGVDFIGNDLIDNQVLKMHFVQKELAKLHKHLIIVFAPNKARYYSDKIPEHYGTPLAETNYSYFKKRLSDFNLNLLDLNSYFVSAKDTCRIPLISKCSIHWSQYGAAVAADSLCRLVANLTSETTCNFTYTLNANNTAKDQDILDAMNLICDIE